MRMIFTLFFTVLLGNIYAQNHNAYLFIEPNVSLRYDNALLQVKDSVSVTLYGTGGYIFAVQQPGRTGSYIQITTERRTFDVGVNTPDSLYNALVNQINRYAGDSIVVQSKKPISHKGFSGLAYTAFHKKRKEYAVVYACTSFPEEGLCKIYFTSWSRQPVSNTDNEHAIVTAVIDGLQSYPQQELVKEDSLVQHAYTVEVDSLGLPGASFTAMVRTKEKLQHVVRGVAMDYQLFTPDYRGNIIIPFNDTEKGRIEKKGELVLLSSIGKQVRLPFTFTYYNK